MSNTMTPFQTVIDAQRQTIEQTRYLFEAGLDAQRTGAETAVEMLSTGKTYQSRALEFEKHAVNTAIDAFEASVPGDDVTTERVREAFNEGFDELATAHEEGWSAMDESLEASLQSFEQLTDAEGEFVAAYFDAVTEAHEAASEATIETAEELAEATEDVVEA